MLAKCGATAKPYLPALLASFEPKNRDAAWWLIALTPLLGPEHKTLLPTLRRFDLSQYGDRAWPEVLWQVGERQEAVDLVAVWLEDNSDRHRLGAARWLARRGQDARSAESGLRRAMSRAKKSEAAQFSLALRRIGGAKETTAQAHALDALDDLLASTVGESPIGGRVSSDRFWSPLAPALERQEDEAVAEAVDTLLGRLSRGDDPEDVLVLSLKDPSPHVRLVAAIALARVEPRHRDLVPILCRLLERQPHFFRYTAETLVALGSLSAPLAPIILPLLRHPDDDVYQAATLVLRRIDPEQARRAWSAAGVPGAVPDDLRPLWDDLAAENPCRVDLAVWRLAGAGTRTVALLRERLRPPPTMTPEQVKRRIADLDNDDFDTRQRASTELGSAIESAQPTLRKALDTALPPETRRRIKELLTRLDAKESPEQRRGRSAVRVLEVIGDRDGRLDARFVPRRSEFGVDPRSGGCPHPQGV